jgi:drug/metabolite transporter (DMT)-like permease
MTLAALALVLVAAVVHASWNLLAKRVSASTDGAVFVWLYGALSAVLYTPPAMWVLLRDRPHLGRLEVGAMAGSALVHLVYFLVLQRGYRTGDLSVVYPLARGTGPLLSTASAVLLLGERPSAVAGAGALLVSVSVFLFASSPQGASQGAEPERRGAAATAARARRRESIAFGLGTGALIAFYTVWDKYAVATLGVAPLLMEWSTSLARVGLLAPVAARRWPLVRGTWARHRAVTLAVAAMNPLSYLLVMIAMVTTPVSYVAPAREVSILIGAVLGARLLGEGDARRRLAAAGLMVVGVVALAVG